MAFSSDAFNTGVTASSGTQIQFVLTVGSLTNGLFVAWVGWSTTSTVLTGGNFRGQPLFLPVQQASQRGAGLLYCYNPPSGVSTGTLTFSANAGRINAGGGSWGGADTTFHPSGVYVASASGNDGAPTVTPTTESNALVVDSAAVSFSGGDTLTAGANQTERGKISGGATITGFSSQSGSDGGAMTWLDSNLTRSWGAVAASFREFVAAGGISHPIFGNGEIQGVMFGGRVIR